MPDESRACPVCGYVLPPLETQCARCKRAAARPGAPQPPLPEPAQAPPGPTTTPDDAAPRQRLGTPAVVGACVVVIAMAFVGGLLVARARGQLTRPSDLATADAVASPDQALPAASGSPAEAAIPSGQTTPQPEPQQAAETGRPLPGGVPAPAEASVSQTQVLSAIAQSGGQGDTLQAVQGWQLTWAQIKFGDGQVPAQALDLRGVELVDDRDQAYPLVAVGLAGRGDLPASYTYLLGTAGVAGQSGALTRPLVVHQTLSWPEGGSAAADIEADTRAEVAIQNPPVTVSFIFSTPQVAHGVSIRGLTSTPMALPEPSGGQ